MGFKLKENEIEKIIVKNHGILRTSDAINAGISKVSFYKYVRKSSDLEKAAHGIYISSDTWIDEMVLLQARIPKAVYSHETALYLHDLAEKEPLPLTVTVPSKYNNPKLLSEDVKTVYVKNDWYELGISTVKAYAGEATITVYDMERTICDIIRKRSTTDPAVFNYAVKKYMKRQDRNLIRLTEYAKVMRLEKTIHETMGVLF